MIAQQKTARTIGRIFLITLALYVGGYLAFRQTRAETWARDSRAYVIFPEGAGRVLYYLWRPLSYLDGRATGMGAHIGPHRD